MEASLFNSNDLKTQLPQDKTAKPGARIRKTPKTVLSKARDSLQEAIGHLEQNEEIHFVSCSQWSTHDLVFHILEQIGPAEITAATWSMSQPAAEVILKYLMDGRITRLRLLLDWRVKVRTPKALQIARTACADLRLTACHGKVCVIENDTMRVSIVGSANFTNNPRIESGVISTHDSVADFHREWLESELAKANPFEVELGRPKERVETED
mgnify:CR=1 FL=1